MLELQSGRFVSGSEDYTLRAWELPPTLTGSTAELAGAAAGRLAAGEAAGGASDGSSQGLFLPWQLGGPTVEQQPMPGDSHAHAAPMAGHHMAPEHSGGQHQEEWDAAQAAHAHGTAAHGTWHSCWRMTQVRRLMAHGSWLMAHGPRGTPHTAQAAHGTCDHGA